MVYSSSHTQGYSWPAGGGGRDEVESKRLLRFNGYEYVTESKSHEKTYWKCKDYWSKKSNVRIHILNVDDSIVQQPKYDHDHPADAAKSEVPDLINKKTTNETTNDILSTFMTDNYKFSITFFKRSAL
ncbi:unnamed protein product [Didymodactylos carnosus]|uniref:FLYWCH-type domain-containing protein n=1 Tax=Didymodactylos carnosus TaxID=1234261 RepID=A0A814QD70_9BILA|nr:unnamed protein product [Didymodactylos carnosus]CAF3881672.1 unnamed protein product [Didymodactylos carnosus]